MYQDWHSGHRSDTGFVSDAWHYGASHFAIQIKRSTTDEQVHVLIEYWFKVDDPFRGVVENDSQRVGSHDPIHSK